tara:strand:+ start:20 stop:697 length:678 start_codon:yes stop_codon:yes gene_type:complete
MREYPNFCESCQNLKSCKQKENMTSNTTKEKGFLCDQFYFCEDCFTPEKDEDYSEIEFLELDCPVHCEDCGSPLIHDLTNEGVKYVCESLLENSGCCREVWPKVWESWIPSFDEEEIVESIGRTLFVCSWASEQEEKGVSFSGCDLMEVAPETSEEFLEEGRRLWDLTKLSTTRDLLKLSEFFVGAYASYMKEEEFGYLFAMESLGSGVGLWEHEKFPVEIPLTC